ncbi:MAG: SRPBCC family protein [Cyclobacteriaceae bacterium]
MKILKTIVLIVVGIAVLAAVAGFLSPSEYNIERSAEMNATPTAVFEEVNDFKKWQAWGTWFQIDPETKYTYEGPESGTGAVVKWVSDHSQVGTGQQTILESKKNESLKTELRFEGYDDPAFADFILEPAGEGTKVTWTMNGTWGKNPFMKLMGNMMITGAIEADYDKSLANLKEIVEAKPSYSYSIEITEEQGAPIKYIGITESVKMEDAAEIGPKMGQLFGELMAYVTEHKLEMAGMPLTVYPKFDETGIDMECALPIKNATEVDGDRIAYKEINADKVVKGVHIGDYQQLQTSHNEVNKYIANNALSIAGDPWEIYVTDPGEVTDTSQWVTHIFYPVGN